ncbi:MAG: hypothetical protein LUG83_09660 [Lachnospiraceae bacterium]|nr:hypothetical protein [Lachnospiraceae bacterium]
MAARIPWNQSEAILLVDAYFMIKKRAISRKLAVQLVSEELRKKALLSKAKIDDVFRNTNGINMRFYEIQYIDSDNKTGLKNTSKLFVETVKMYSDNARDFQSKYNDAIKEIYGNAVSAFTQWVNSSKYYEARKPIEYSLRILETIGKKEGLTKESLCNISNFGKVVEFDQVVRDDIFFEKYRRAGYDHEKLFTSYRDYLNEERKEMGSEIVGEMITDNGTKAKAFSKWLIDVMKLSMATARGYSSAINTATPYAQEFCGLTGSIYDIDDVEILETLLERMMADDRFAEINYQSHNRFRGTFDRYLQFSKAKNLGQVDTIYETKNPDDSFDRIEEFVREADVDGITASILSGKTGKSIWLVNKYLREQAYAIEIPNGIYIHANNVIDLFENKAEIQKIIENQFDKFCGYTNDEVLMDAATISLGMFLNDNCIDTPAKFYGIVRYLFGKTSKMYYFAGDKHIWKSESKYPDTNAGVLMGFILSNGGRASKKQCAEYLQKVKLASGNINGLLSVATNKDVLLYGNEEYVLTENIIENESWIDLVKRQINRLFQTVSYVIPREISDNWFELLPPLYDGLNWNLALLQDLIKKYMPEYRLITANENQGIETIRAGIVPEDSIIGNFADLVYARLIEDSTLNLPIRLEKEDLRQKLIEYKMIQGNELIYTLPKALDGVKYAWTDDGESVLILQ